MNDRSKSSSWRPTTTREDKVLTQLALKNTLAMLVQPFFYELLYKKVFSNNITSSSRLQKFFSNCSRWDGGFSRIIKVPFKIFDVAFLLLSFSRVSSFSSIEVVDNE